MRTLANYLLCFGWGILITQFVPTPIAGKFICVPVLFVAVVLQHIVLAKSWRN